MSKLSTMNRRTVLQLSAAAAIGAASTRFAAAADKPAIRLGVCSYSFRKFGPDKVIEFMHALRCRNLNVKDVHLPMTPLADVPALAKHYRDAGLQLTNAGTVYFRVDTDEDVRAKFEYLKAAGVKSFVGAPQRAVLPRVERFIKEYDIRMGLHNHGPHDPEWASPFDVQKVIEPLDHRIGYCIDVGHTLKIGVDPLKAIQMAGARLYDLHVRDLKSADENAEPVPVGTGVMPLRGILRALAEMRYPYTVDLELEDHETDPLPGNETGLSALRGMIAELGYREG